MDVPFHFEFTHSFTLVVKQSQGYFNMPSATCSHMKGRAGKVICSDEPWINLTSDEQSIQATLEINSMCID